MSHECKNCGASVSQSYWRVFCDRNGEIHACPDCSTANEILNGKATGFDPDERKL